ncbi:hypothetical protein ACO0K9_03840 [Undibacterium sp. Ji50W]
MLIETKRQFFCFAYVMTWCCTLQHVKSKWKVSTGPIQNSGLNFALNAAVDAALDTQEYWQNEDAAGGTYCFE